MTNLRTPGRQIHFVWYDGALASLPTDNPQRSGRLIAGSVLCQGSDGRAWVGGCPGRTFFGFFGLFLRFCRCGTWPV